MKYNHDKPKGRRVAEPVQVYLRPPERDRLERLTAKLDTSKSDVLRRGLEALEGQLSDPGRHPALEIIGIASSDRCSRPSMWRVAHDEYLAASEIDSWCDVPRGAGEDARAARPGSSGGRTPESK